MKTPRKSWLKFPHYSPKSARLASVLLALLSLCATPAFAASAEYSVEGITIDADGADASTARTKALAMGEQEAFRQLVTRRNPEQAASMGKLSNKIISSLVRGFQVSDEKMTAGHYHAAVRYNFDPMAIQGLLGPATVAYKAPPGATATPASPAAPATPAPPAAVTPATQAAPAPAALPTLPLSETMRTSKAVLVLPVYNDGNSLKLWQDDNKWRTIWFEAALESGGGLVVVPQGDLDDRVDVDDTNVNAATSASLSRMYDRYGVSAIYVLSAFYDLKADPKPTLIVTLKRISPQNVETTTQSYIIRVTETLDMLMMRASADIAHLIYKLQSTDPSKIEYERLKTVEAHINAIDMKDWQDIRKHLVVRGNIVDIKFTSIAYDQTTLTFTYKGTLDMLGKTLVSSGLRVLQDGDKFILSMP